MSAASDLYERRRGQVLPKLTPAHIARLAARAERATTREATFWSRLGGARRALFVLLKRSLEVTLLPGMDG
jgi:hypothetical protein